MRIPPLKIKILLPDPRPSFSSQALGIATKTFFWASRMLTASVTVASAGFGDCLYMMYDMYVLYDMYVVFVTFVMYVMYTMCAMCVMYVMYDMYDVYVVYVVYARAAAARRRACPAAACRRPSRLRC